MSRRAHLHVLAFCAGLLLTARGRAAEPLNALLVGGGADLASNAAQIESHVRFVASLLPPGTRRRLLFADGKPDNPSVSFADDSPLGQARAALSVLLPNSGLTAPAVTHRPALGVKLDGPAARDAIRRAVGELIARSGREPEGPTLFYFAGHGARDDDNEPGAYCLWNDERFTVRELAAEIARVPARPPVVLVMAQCYSGAFADALFRGGNPKGEPIPQDFVGFFSAHKDRTASGCGVETDAADYQDFSSYFFGALMGHDRFGKPVNGADCDGDGRVSLHEAFCYALGHDESFDTPVCTSDMFLERFAGLPDDQIFTQPYAAVWKAASAGQRAALEALSARLDVTGEDRALAVYDRLTLPDPIGRSEQFTRDRDSADRLSLLRATALGPLLKKWPGLRWTQSAQFAGQAEAAAQDLAGRDAASREIIAAQRAHDQADAALDNEEAWLMRFADLYRSVARAEYLRKEGAPAVRARFNRLWEAEGASLPLIHSGPAGVQP